MENKKYKVIIDTDPGVDDTACMIFALNDKNLDIKLISTVCGNVSVQKATRNTLHILDLFNLDFPVVVGADKAMYRLSDNAEFIHQEEGLGGYAPSNVINHKPIEGEAAEVMYKILNEGDGDIIPILIGPQTNMGLLLHRHPDIVKKIPRILFMGGSPFGLEGQPEYISFNISSDPEAFKFVIESKIPLVMIPSNVGRDMAHLTEEYVNNLQNINDVGKLLYKMYNQYWEPEYKDKRIATNDSCVYFYLIAPEIFKTRKVDIDVDLKEKPGKTITIDNENGQVDVVVGVDREKFINLMTEKIKDLNNIKLNI